MRPTNAVITVNCLRASVKQSLKTYNRNEIVGWNVFRVIYYTLLGQVPTLKFHENYFIVEMQASIEELNWA